MNLTGIEWVVDPDGSQGFTCNSKTGCLNGCPYCYAYKLANGRLRQRYLSNSNVIPLYIGSAVEIWQAEHDPFYPRWWPERLEQIRKRKKPAGIFLDDMSDWMGDYWPKEWTEMELQVMRDYPQHRFYTLTKQPQNLLRWTFPQNCWVGVTATNESMFIDAVEALNEIDARVKYISIEPLLARINPPMLVAYLEVLDWLTIGSCTGKKYELLGLCQQWNINRQVDTKPLRLMPWNGIWTLQPKTEWVKEIVNAADRAGVPVFLKDNLKPIMAPWIAENLRQEFPDTGSFLSRYANQT